MKLGTNRGRKSDRCPAWAWRRTFVEEEERAYLQDIQKLIRKQIDVAGNHPYTTTSVAPVSLTGNERIIRPKGPAGRPPREGRGGNSNGRGGAPRSATGNSNGGRSEQRAGGRPQPVGERAASGSRPAASNGDERRSSGRPWQAGRGGAQGGGGRRSE